VAATGGPGWSRGPGQPGAVARFTLGLALTHTSVEPGAQEYWFAELGTAPNPFGDAAPPAELVVPRLESLAPGYVCYPLDRAVTVRPPRWQALLQAVDPASAGLDTASSEGLALAPDSRLLALHPRPRGVGFNQDRAFRWQPLLVARDTETQDYRGAVATMIAHVHSPYRGGVWALFTQTIRGSIASRSSPAGWKEVARRLRRPVYLQEGGSEFFTVFPGQAVTLGARVVNFGENAVTNVQVLLSVIDQRHGKLAHRYRQTLRIAAGDTETVTHIWAPTTWPDQGCVVARSCWRRPGDRRAVPRTEPLGAQGGPRVSRHP